MSNQGYDVDRIREADAAPTILQRQRILLGKSAAQVCKATGITTARLERLECGLALPTVPEVTGLVRLFKEAGNVLFAKNDAEGRAKSREGRLI